MRALQPSAKALRARTLRPFTFPSVKYLSACLAAFLSIAIKLTTSKISILPIYEPAKPASPVNAPNRSPGRILFFRPTLS